MKKDEQIEKVKRRMSGMLKTFFKNLILFV